MKLEDDVSAGRGSGLRMDCDKTQLAIRDPDGEKVAEIRDMGLSLSIYISIECRERKGFLWGI